MLIIGMCGVGKTTYVANHKNAIDLTCIEPGLSVLQKAVAKYEYVLGDPSWIMVFIESGLPMCVVVPSKDRKDEYLANYRERYKNGTGGGDDKFCHFVGDKWNEWIDGLSSAPCPVFELGPGEWLDDVISYLSQCQTY